MKRPTLQEFLEKGRRCILPQSEYLSAAPLTVYARAGRYHYDIDTKKRRMAFGISNVSLHKKHHGKGIFREFIMQAEQLAKTEGYEVIRVEEVLNPKLREDLHKHGYVLYRNECLAPILFKYL